MRRCPVVSSGDNWSGCAARVHILTQGGLWPEPVGKGDTAVSNDRRAGTGTSRGHSTESNEPETKRPEGLTTREGLNFAGRTRPRVVSSRSAEADWLSYRPDHRGRESVLPSPGGLPGIAGRGPACPVVWEAEGAIPTPTRFGDVIGPQTWDQHRTRGIRISYRRRPRSALLAIGAPACWSRTTSSVGLLASRRREPRRRNNPARTLEPCHPCILGTAVFH